MEQDTYTVLINSHNKLGITTFLVYIIFFVVLLSVVPNIARGAVLLVGPSSGTFTVGSTFDVSLLLDTEGKAINAIEASMSFSPDKLQVVSPSVGKSVIEVWTTSPKFNNQTGTMSLQGGIPGGFNARNGLVTTVTFRVKSVGAAILKFHSDSKVLLHDGLGTDALTKTVSGVYQFILPPPGGPLVASPTHQNQSTWYANPNVVLNWASSEYATGYSYVLNKEAVNFPDDIPEGNKTALSYKELGDGVHYFHIKSFRNGMWGGTTHFAIQIDTTPPAKFPLEIIPSSRTVRRQPIVQFESTDVSSGIDHYELKLVPLSLKSTTEEQPLFIEAVSPHVLPPLDFGKYDIIMRAYDKAGNYREVTRRLSIVHAVLNFISGEGLELRNVVIIPWQWFFGILLLIFIGLAYGAFKVKNWHTFVTSKILQKILPKDVKSKVEELKRYNSKYGPKIFLLMLIIGSLIAISHPVSAQQEILVNPPLVTTLSRDISNEEIFYIGGKTEISNVEVILYLQNLQTGETISRAVVSDKNGDWFYRHDTFLQGGNYLLWAQNKIGDIASPPSPQTTMSVKATAIQFGSSRISHEILYLIMSMVLLLVSFGLILYIVFHGYHGRKKHVRLVKEIREAEESVRRGFAVLRRDIQAEFSMIKKLKAEKGLSQEEKSKEIQLLKDLQEVEQYIGKEIWDVEEAEYAG